MGLEIRIILVTTLNWIVFGLLELDETKTENFMKISKEWKHNNLDKCLQTLSLRPFRELMVRFSKELREMARLLKIIRLRPQESLCKNT